MVMQLALNLLNWVRLPIPLLRPDAEIQEVILSKKKDEYSWRYGGIKRRDFRHTNDGPEVPRHKGTKKSTKKWCKGKKGVEHIPIRKIKYYTIRGERKEAYRFTECEKCGKRLGYEWNRGGLLGLDWRNK